MAKFCPLFSSSKGNCAYIGSGDSGILIDTGRSAKQINEALFNIGVDPDSLNAIFITHEHSDHISGLRVFAEKHKIKVYATEGTLSALEEKNILTSKIEYDAVSFDGTQAGSLLVTPFRTSHDAKESCGYLVDTPDGRRLAVCTDLGYVSDEVSSAVCGSDLVLLESNHDIMMLENGLYTYDLKQRIKGKRGHLSNECCAELAQKLVQSGTTRLVLGHLSQENNIPQLAYQTTFAALSASGAKEDSDYILKVAKPDWEGKAILL